MFKNVLFAVGLIQLLMSFSSYACSCVRFDPVAAIHYSDNILRVRVTRVEKIQIGNSKALEKLERQGYFEVLKTYKGSADLMPYLVSVDKPICCMCDIQLEQGKEYIIFNSVEGPVYLSQCGQTKTVVSGLISELEQLIDLVVKDVEPQVFHGSFNGKTHQFYDISQAKELSLVGTHLWPLSAGQYLVKFKGYLLSDNRIYALNLIQSGDPAKRSNELIYESRDR